MRNIRFVFASLVLSLPSVALADRPNPGAGSCFYVMASRQTIDEANAFINRTIDQSSHYFDETDFAVALSENGWLAITLGAVRESDFERLKSEYVSKGWSPDDAFCSAGSKYTLWVDDSYEAAPVVPAGGGTTKYVQSSDGELNIRTGPSTEYGIVSVIYNGDAVRVLETRGNWSRITTETATRIQGWVYSPLLTVHAGSETAREPENNETPSYVIQLVDDKVEEAWRAFSEAFSKRQRIIPERDSSSSMTTEYNIVPRQGHTAGVELCDLVISETRRIFDANGNWRRTVMLSSYFDAVEYATHVRDIGEHFYFSNMVGTDMILFVYSVGFAQAEIWSDAAPGLSFYPPLYDHVSRIDLGDREVGREIIEEFSNLIKACSLAAAIN